MDLEALQIPHFVLNNINYIWTFLLLSVRFTGLMMLVPGIGMGMRGMMIRTPSVLVLAFAAMSASPLADIPQSSGMMIVEVFSEILLGSLLGLIPLFIIVGVQTAGQLASTTMGLQASNLIDPTLNISVPDLARIYGDLVIIMFLLMGGHHVVIYVASSMGGVIVPGAFAVQAQSLNVLVELGGEIFRVGVLIAAPVIVALLLTNFVMGLISKAVPSVNIFIISFPLTIGIGLALSVLALPDLVSLMRDRLLGLEGYVLRAIS